MVFQLRISPIVKRAEYRNCEIDLDQTSECEEGVCQNYTYEYQWQPENEKRYLLRCFRKTVGRI
jgi:hypothetical protein